MDSVQTDAITATATTLDPRTSSATRKLASVDATINSQRSASSVTNADLGTSTSPTADSANATDMQTPATQPLDNATTAGITHLGISAKNAT